MTPLQTVLNAFSSAIQHVVANHQAMYQMIAENPELSAKSLEALAKMKEMDLQCLRMLGEVGRLMEHIEA
jgi:lactam utilization protein B